MADHGFPKSSEVRVRSVDLNFDKSLASGYISPAQRVRVLTESWVHREMYCPNCGRASLKKYPNNDPVRDFNCGNCSEDFELKAKRNAFGVKIVDGEYRTMLSRLQSNEVPNFFALSYDAGKSCVLGLVVIPSHFLVPELIERRKPLAKTARRAGWTGCNILYGEIPQAGRVSVVARGVPVSKPSVLSAWKRTLFLREQKKVEARGWTLDVMRCVEKLDLPEFDLTDVYRFEGELSCLHPYNRHVRAKIRQQLQVLRDAEYLEFSGHGRYRIK